MQKPNRNFTVNQMLESIFDPDTSARARKNTIESKGFGFLLLPANAETVQELLPKCFDPSKTPEGLQFWTEFCANS